MRSLTLTLLLSGLGAAFAAPAQAQTVFKIGTLAPEGSSWMRLWREWATSVEKRTSGRVKMKFFASGTQGDEREVVQKMRGGLLNGAGVTGVGLGQINEEVRVLELPGLFKSTDELDHVRKTLGDEFVKKFADAKGPGGKGYVLLAWGEVGWVHIYSNIPLKTRQDIAKTKIWSWTDDPLVRALFKNLGITGVPLGVPDVQAALQTGTIDACYGSPFSMVALQWHSKVKYATSGALSIATGATVLAKKDFDKLSPEDQKVVLEEGKILEEKTLTTVRKDNERAEAKMKQLGIQTVETPPALQEELKKAGLGVWDELQGKMYSKEWLDKIKKILADYRKSKS